MNWWDPDFYLSLVSIVIIDLVLAGDNAIVIGMVARRLPRETQRRTIFWGTAAAIAIRTVLTLFVVWLISIPFLLLFGGLILLWIAYALLAEEKKDERVRAGDNLLEAVRTIAVADVVMGLDNILAIAGAAHGSFLLVVLGLLISIPVMVWGSTVILRLIERFPPLIYLGAGVLAWTAARMITEEPFWREVFAANPGLKWGVTAFAVAGVLVLGRWRQRRCVHPR